MSKVLASFNGVDVLFDVRWDEGKNF